MDSLDLDCTTDTTAFFWDDKHDYDAKFPNGYLYMSSPLDDTYFMAVKSSFSNKCVVFGDVVCFRSIPDDKLLESSTWLCLGCIIDYSKEKYVSIFLIDKQERKLFMQLTSSKLFSLEFLVLSNMYGTDLEILADTLGDKTPEAYELIKNRRHEYIRPLNVYVTDIIVTTSRGLNDSIESVIQSTNSIVTKSEVHSNLMFTPSDRDKSFSVDTSSKKEMSTDQSNWLTMSVLTATTAPANKNKNSKAKLSTLPTKSSNRLRNKADSVSVFTTDVVKGSTSKVSTSNASTSKASTCKGSNNNDFTSKDSTSKGSPPPLTRAERER